MKRNEQVQTVLQNSFLLTTVSQMDQDFFPPRIQDAIAFTIRCVAVTLSFGLIAPFLGLLLQEIKDMRTTHLVPLIFATVAIFALKFGVHTAFGDNAGQRNAFRSLDAAVQEIERLDIEQPDNLAVVIRNERVARGR